MPQQRRMPDRPPRTLRQPSADLQLAKDIGPVLTDAEQETIAELLARIILQNVTRTDGEGLKGEIGGQ